MERRKIGDVHDQALVAVAHAQGRDQGQGGPGEEETGQGMESDKMDFADGYQ